MDKLIPITYGIIFIVSTTVTGYSMWIDWTN